MCHFRLDVLSCGVAAGAVAGSGCSGEVNKAVHVHFGTGQQCFCVLAYNQRNRQCSVVVAFTLKLLSSSK